jgi:type I restriction enzyme, S subunit
MVKWQTRSLGELLTFQRGFDITKAEQREGPYNVISSSGANSTHVAYKVKGPGVVIGRKGSLGTVFYSEADFWPHDTTLWVKDFHGNYPKFAYYFLQTMHLERLDVGAANPSLNRNHIHTIPVRWPSLPVQKRLASILTPYDELIENSQRRIQILEAMARTLFREWFVQFRFPGHEKVHRVASPLGEIPEGWEIKKLVKVADVNRTQINSANAPSELHYIDISSVSPGEIHRITTYTFAEAPDRARRVVQHGDTLWSCVRPNRRSHAQVMHPQPNTIASTGFAVLTPRTVPFTFLHFATTTDDFVAYLANNASGAAYPAVTAATFEKADLLVPSESLLMHFADATIPTAEQIHILQRQIRNLRRTRDLLLPRLMSGQIDVSRLCDSTLAENLEFATASAP